MICEKCRIREANIKYTEVIGGVKTEHNLCSQCAQEMDFGQYSAIFDGEFPLGKLLSGLLGLSSPASRPQRAEEVVCPNCRTSYEEFISNSRFGCADCYHVFDLLIGEKIKKLQENASHTGKQPKMRPACETVSSFAGDGSLELSGQEQVSQLERQLKAALRIENYEEAAVCRDRIRALKGEKQKNDEMV
jgi:protein arginine kinase activator